MQPANTNIQINGIWTNNQRKDKIPPKYAFIAVYTTLHKHQHKCASHMFASAPSSQRLSWIMTASFLKTAVFRTTVLSQ